MAQEASELLQWMPVIGTLSGAIVALIATFGAAYFNHNKVGSAAKEQRQRERLECIYHSLISIKELYLSQLNKIMSMIDGVETSVLSEPSTKGIPPILQLEMYINLYFPELKNEHIEFSKARDIFASLMVKTLTGELRTMTPRARQAFRSELIDASELVDDKINKIREKIYLIARA